MSISISGKLVDLHQKRIYPASIVIEGKKIISITEMDGIYPEWPFILPGFVDAHVHIESSMLVPSEFAKLAVIHGTVGTVSDPHEIANVCGIGGIEFMIENGNTVPFKFNFGAPSCVPATHFETAGASLNAEQVTALLQKPEIKYLSEMMNFPGVLSGEEEVMQKLAAAIKMNKRIDGHAPGLRGEQARKYIEAGRPGEVTISTDHECFTKEEAVDKLKYGMKILIREGSAAKNFEALIDLLHDHPEKMMFCSDDKHPDSLVAGHINQLCSRAVNRNIDIFKILAAACLNPVQHYGLDIGLLRENDPADFIVVKDLEHFEVIQTYIDGQLVAEKGKTLIKTTPSRIINQFRCSAKKTGDFYFGVDGASAGKIEIIEALDGQLITGRESVAISGLTSSDNLESNIERDILKISVVNRYNDTPPAIAFIRNFGLKKGAIASSVAHDSHNIIAVAVDDKSLCRAVNAIIRVQGGICCVEGESEMVLPLPVAGLMSNRDGFEIAAQYTAIDQMAKDLGSKLSAPFMTLSFMALLVIPHLKLSDKGLFDGDRFKLI